MFIASWVSCSHCIIHYLHSRHLLLYCAIVLQKQSCKFLVTSGRQWLCWILSDQSNSALSKAIAFASFYPSAALSWSHGKILSYCDRSELSKPLGAIFHAVTQDVWNSSTFCDAKIFTIYAYGSFFRFKLQSPNRTNALPWHAPYAFSSLHLTLLK